jgi:hypothetical protein
VILHFILIPLPGRDKNPVRNIIEVAQAWYLELSLICDLAIGIQEFAVKLLERIIDTVSRLSWISQNQSAE